MVSFQKEIITDFTMIADDPRHQFSHSEALLLCLNYITFQNQKPKFCETFFESFLQQVRTIAKTN